MAKSIILKGIGKAYNPGKKVLQELNLTINQGEMFFLLGPSGCGKSTLLRIIAGLLEPDCGEIYFDEQRVDKLPPEKRAAAMVSGAPKKRGRLPSQVNCPTNRETAKGKRGEISPLV